MGKKYLCLVLYFCMLLFVASCSSSRFNAEGLPLQVIAHRGGPSMGVENSLSCIEKGIEAGADVVEIDVRMTLDSVLVLMHDAKVDRTTNGTGAVAKLTLEQIKSLSLCDDDGVETGERVPTLDEALMLVNGRCKMLIEVKDNDERGSEREVIASVLRCGAQEWVAVQSFRDSVLVRFNKLNAPFPIEKLFVYKYPLFPYIYDGTTTRISPEKYHFVSSFNVKKGFAPRGLIKRLRSWGKGVKLWGVRKKARSSKLVDAVITDFPQCW